MTTLSILTVDERKALEWALWFSIAYLRHEAKSFSWPAEDNIVLLKSVEHKLLNAAGTEG